MTKDERIKELEDAAMQLFDMVHESENIQNKIKANDIYDTITVKNLSQHLVSKSACITKECKFNKDNECVRMDLYNECIHKAVC